MWSAAHPVWGIRWEVSVSRAVRWKGSSRWEIPRRCQWASGASNQVILKRERERDRDERDRWERETESEWERQENTSEHVGKWVQSVHPPPTQFFIAWASSACNWNRHSTMLKFLKSASLNQHKLRGLFLAPVNCIPIDTYQRTGKLSGLVLFGVWDLLKPSLTWDIERAEPDLDSSCVTRQPTSW